MRIRDIFNLSGSAMRAQSTRMRVIAENVANAETIDDGKGVPYQRKLTILDARGASQNASAHGAALHWIRRINEEYEKMLAGQQTAQQALDNAVERGNAAIKEATQ